MLRFVCWKWQSVRKYRTKFTAQHVNTLRNMIERHYHADFEVVCITDDKRGIDPRVRVVPLWNDFADLPSPHGASSPACYRRLRAFSPEMVHVIGPRFVSIDLDMVVVGDITPLFDRPEDFVIWASPIRTTPYNGGLWMMNAGARPQVFTRFNPYTSPKEARKAGFNGSDQAWISYVLGPDEATWQPERDGVYAFRTDIRNRDWKLPANARIISFHGSEDPWDVHARERAPWINEHYK